MRIATVIILQLLLTLNLQANAKDISTSKLRSWHLHRAVLDNTTLGMPGNLANRPASIASGMSRGTPFTMPGRAVPSWVAKSTTPYTMPHHGFPSWGIKSNPLRTKAHHLLPSVTRVNVVTKSASNEELFLGFDLSTQSCKAVVIDKDLKVQCSSKVVFDEDLPKYGTSNGVIVGKNGRVTSSPLMWMDALELSLERLKDSGCPLKNVKAVSGSGQQHGSVYWAKDARKALQGLDASKGSLTDQLSSAFATLASPIWMDTSCTESCQSMEKCIGGPLELAGMTGSRAYERFTGHLIRQFINENGLDACSRVSLVSSFGASLLVGDFASIDASDGAGMNLMDIKSLDWRPEPVDFVSGGESTALLERLGGIAEPWTPAGDIHPYFQEKYGFSGGTKVVHWSGDNPCSVVGLGLLKAGDLAISLGTSDTCLAVLAGAPKPMEFGHVFPHPLLKDTYWSMLCYSNGDVTRRSIRDEFAAGDWDKFSACLDTETQPGNDGGIGIYYTTDEITPPIAKRPAVRAVSEKGQPKNVEAFEKTAQNCRAVIEHRALAIRSHLGRLSPSLLEPNSEARLLLTGGASANPAIRQVFADAMGRKVFTLDVPDSAALGAAYRALDGSGAAPSQDELVTGIASKAQPFEDPKPGVSEGVYTDLTSAYGKLEASLEKRLADANAELVQTSSDLVSIPTLALISLFVCSGVTFAVLRFLRGALTTAKEPFLAV